MISNLSDAQIKLLFGSTNIPKRSLTGAVRHIGDNAHSDYIEDKHLKRNSILNKAICEFLTHIGFDVDFYIKERKLNLSRKNKKPLPLIPKIQFIEVWEYFAELVINGDIVLETPEKVYDDESLIDCNPRLVHFCEEHGKGEDLDKLRKSIPVSRETDLAFVGFTYDIVDPSNNWKYMFINNLRKLKTMEDVKELYESTIEALPGQEEYYVEVNNFFNTLFNIKCDGLGKGEIFCASLVDGARIMGGTEPFDLVIENDVTNEIHELKVMNDKGSIRLGKTKLQKYRFSQHVNKVFEVANRLYNITYRQDYGLPSNLFDLWGIVISECQTAWIDGEVGESTLRKFIGFLYYMHDFINKKGKKFYRSGVITEVNDGVLNEYSVSVNDNDTLEYDMESLLLEFGTLRYVQNPDLLLGDLQATVKEYFNRHVDYITIFRTLFNRVNICKEDDLVFDTITQSAVKFIERKYSTRKRDQYPEYLAWVRYCADKSQSFDELYEEELMKK